MSNQDTMNTYFVAFLVAIRGSPYTTRAAEFTLLLNCSLMSATACNSSCSPSFLLPSQWGSNC